MLALFSTLISIIQKPASKRCMHCAKRDFLHTQYAVYLHAIDAWHVVKCGTAAVMWCDVTAITVAPHIPFRILPSALRMPQFRILPISFRMHL